MRHINQQSTQQARRCEKQTSEPYDVTCLERRLHHYFYGWPQAAERPGDRIQSRIRRGSLLRPYACERHSSGVHRYQIGALSLAHKLRSSLIWWIRHGPFRLPPSTFFIATQHSTRFVYMPQLAFMMYACSPHALGAEVAVFRPLHRSRKSRQLPLTSQ